MKISVVQRRCGERTQEKHLDSYRDFQDVTIASEGDLFSNTVKCLNDSLRKKCDWSLIINADIRLYDNCIEYIINELKNVDTRSVYQVGFVVDDKFLGSPIFGVFAHNNKHIAKCSDWFIKKGEKGISAESNNIFNFMNNYNLKITHSNIVIGSHDFGQWYQDLYDKFLIIGTRYRKQLNQFIQHVNYRHINFDNDFDVAVRALKDSEKLPKNFNVKRKIYNVYPILKSMGIEEKNSLLKNKCDSDNKACRYSDNCNFIDVTVRKNNF